MGTCTKTKLAKSGPCQADSVHPHLGLRIALLPCQGVSGHLFLVDPKPILTAPVLLHQSTALDSDLIDSDLLGNELLASVLLDKELIVSELLGDELLVYELYDLSKMSKRNHNLSASIYDGVIDQVKVKLHQSRT